MNTYPSSRNTRKHTAAKKVSLIDFNFSKLNSKRSKNIMLERIPPTKKELTNSLI